MRSYSISENYNLKWQFKFDDKYKVSVCRKIINTKSGCILKECVNGYSIGYWFGKKFIPKSKLNDYIELIPNYKLPF